MADSYPLQRRQRLPVSVDSGDGTNPVWPDMILQKSIRPALERAGIRGKTVGWHTFRHSLGTNPRTLGVDVKVAQELLRHANSE
jgi:site-specific recombinase XerD